MTKNILIIEDATFVREMEKKILSGHDYNVVGESNNESEGVELYQKLNPDLVIMDLQLAEGNGVSAMQKIRQINSDAKFIIVSSHTAILDDSRQELQSNIISILHKPFSAEELVSILDNIQD